jgi:exosortase/archaeosortase family protein
MQAHTVLRDAPRRRATVHVAVALAAIALAYRYSLTTIIRGVGLQTPLAYLGLVPLLALAVAFGRVRPSLDEPEIHDRQLDWIVASPLFGIAFVILAILPTQLSVLYWQRRIDLLSLPFFVVGVVTLVFGVRTTWRLRLPFLFLFLAWPLPWTSLLGPVLDTVTSATLATLHRIASATALAVPVANSDGSLFRIGHGGAAFVVSVASPCSGVNGLVGFLLAGGAFLALVRGSQVRKLVWLAVGLAVTWTMNIGRLAALLYVGKRWGEGPAIEVLHPYLGLVTFSLGVLLMIVVMPRFGIAPAPAATPDERDAFRARRPAVARSLPALLTIAALAVPIGALDSGMRRFSLVAGDLGAPRLTALGTGPPSVPGWRVHLVDTYPWAQQYFGTGSTWRRYQYGATIARAGEPGTVVVDAVETGDLSRFDTYNLDACYSFHRYAVHARGHADLGGGIRAETVSFTQPQLRSDWNVVAWIWPVRSPSGATRYERVVLMAPGERSSSPFLVRFAGRLVHEVAAAKPPSASSRTHA